LLARASDTIADAGQLGIQERRDLLARFVKFVTEGKTFRMPEVKGLPEGEKVLMSRLDDCMAALENLPDRQQVSVRKVVKIITEGQCWDLDRFAGEGVVSLDSDDELRTYTYQVAGCVGEFWTEIGIEEGGEFARASDDEMMRWGQAYGRSLQLINILRDVPEDQNNGRCYLPGARTRKQLLRERQRWIKEAYKGLDQAERYTRSLNGRRMRFGTVLPAMIGRKTLSRLEAASWEEWEAGVKISRKEVYGMMVKAAIFAIS
jgi:farnesyl-diphosphate farnesyltransferase